MTFTVNSPCGATHQALGVSPSRAISHCMSTIPSIALMGSHGVKTMSPSRAAIRMALHSLREAHVILDRGCVETLIMTQPHLYYFIAQVNL